MVQQYFNSFSSKYSFIKEQPPVTSEEKIARWKTLTPRERQVAELICKANGRRPTTNPQMAVQLGISRETVKIHVRNIFNKFDIHSKVELRQALNGLELF